MKGNSVNSRTIENRSVRGRDLNNFILDKLRAGEQARDEIVDGGAAGPAGENGADGQDGADGEDGQDGADGEDSAQGPAGEDGAKGSAGAKGDKGDSGLQGAFYSVASYDVGNTNAGAIATVACSSDSQDQDYVAINGGVQVLGLDDGANSRNTPVSSSFPGRMDFSKNAPKPGRLDGWIIQFGGNAQTEGASDKSPEKVKVWALCVPGADIPVEETFVQSGG